MFKAILDFFFGDEPTIEPIKKVTVYPHEPMSKSYDRVTVEPMSR